jgi:putative membrane protein
MCAMSGMMDGSMSAGMFLMMMVGPLLFLGLLGIIIYFVVRLLMRKNKVQDHPLMILKERFAKGEIDEAEYKQKKKSLDEA